MTEWKEPSERGARRFVMTDNNYTQANIEKLNNFSKPTYLVYGKESGVYETPHLQIYMEFKDAVTYRTLQKLLFPCWMKQAIAHPMDAAGYCKKGICNIKPKQGWREYFLQPHETFDGNEFGCISNQGKRTDIDEPSEMISNGATMLEVAQQYPSQVVKYHKGFEYLRSLLMQPRNLPHNPEVIVLWGPTGTGKTYSAIHEYWPDVPHYLWHASYGQWWPKYDGQMKVIIDEFRSRMDYETMLSLLQRYQLQVPYKGGFHEMQADKFVITSPYHPNLWFDDQTNGIDSIDQLKRRITKIVHMTQVFSESSE